MKQAFTALLLAMIITSCLGDRRNNNNAQDPVTTVSETSTSKELFSKGRYREDMIERLYREKLKSSPELEKLERSLQSALDYEDSVRSFREYDGKSKEFYSDADRYVAGIEDSVLKQKVKSLVDASAARYAMLTSANNTSLEELRANNRRITDLHGSVKVLLTLPDIESYQKKNLPSAAPMQKAAAKQKRVISKLDSIVIKSGVN